MKKTITYKNIQNLIKKSKFKKISFGDYLDSYFLHENYGWIKFSLKEDFNFKESLALCFGYLNSKDILNKENLTNYGIYDRILINSKGNISYCAGQDYSCEAMIIRSLLKYNN